MTILYDLCACVETPPPVFIVGNHLDSGVMARLAMDGLLNEI